VPVRAWGTPAWSEGTVYTLSASHEVFAVEARTGRRRWQVATGEAGEGTRGSRLVAAGTFVVVGDDNVVAMEKTSGKVAWRFRPKIGYGPGLYLGEASDGLVFAGSPAGQLYAIDAATGVLRWHATIGDAAQTTVYAPVASGDLVAAGFTTFGSPTGGGVVAVDAKTGDVRWRRIFPVPTVPTIDTGLAGGPIVADDAIIVGRRDGVVEALDRRTGVVRWLLPPVRASGLPADASRHDFRALAVSGGGLVVGSLTGVVAAFDLPTERARWRVVPSMTSVAFAMTAGRGVVYVPFMSGEIVAIDAVTGRERWRVGRGDRPFRWPPLIVGRRLYAASSTAGLFAFVF
jgi:outer membrane protein assembly factor BamB